MDVTNGSSIRFRMVSTLGLIVALVTVLASWTSKDVRTIAVPIAMVFGWTQFGGL